MGSLLIKNANVVTHESTKKLDIFIENDKIKDLGENLNNKCDNIIDASGRYVLPGLIDIHVHLREPGLEYKEDIESGSKAAVAGGFTSICCMPNTMPVCDNAATVSYIKKRGEEVGLTKVYPIGAISKGSKGEELAEIGKMKKVGIVAVSDDGKPVMNSKLMRYAMEYSDDFNLFVLDHAEDSNLVDEGVVNEGINSSFSGLKGSPAMAEEIAVSRDIILAEGLNKKIHICHTSTKSSLKIIKDAKARGVKVTCESCPHYFILTDESILSYDTFYKVNPPLRTKEDKEAVINAIKDGTIDCIVTDHAPHHLDEKNVEFNIAAFGISGLETSFCLSYTNLVKKGHISLNRLVELMSYNPSKILNLQGGVIEKNNVADLTIVNIDDKFKINTAKFYSKGKNSPFNDFEVYGKIEYTIMNGNIVFKA